MYIYIKRALKNHNTPPVPLLELSSPPNIQFIVKNIFFTIRVLPKIELQAQNSLVGCIPPILGNLKGVCLLFVFREIRMRSNNIMLVCAMIKTYK